MAEKTLVVQTIMEVEALAHFSVRRSAKTPGITTYATQLAIGDWTTMDGAAVPASKYPAALTLALVCSPGATNDRPRARIPEEVYVPATNRWAAGHGWAGGVWRPVNYADRTNYLELMAAAYDFGSDRVLGTSPTYLPAGEYMMYDAWDAQWVSHAALRFTGNDVLTSKTNRWASDDGVGALGVFIIDDVNDNIPVWVMGFSPPDPTTMFGLGITAQNGQWISLMITDDAGTRPLISIDTRASFNTPIMLGMTYSARTGKASLLVRGAHVREEREVTLTQINGQSAGAALASLDFGLMYSLTEDQACVFDVAMWIGEPEREQWVRSVNAYTELYGMATSPKDVYL